jgi:hypothetical protein
LLLGAALIQQTKSLMNIALENELAMVAQSHGQVHLTLTPLHFSMWVS